MKFIPILIVALTFILANPAHALSNQTKVWKGRSRIPASLMNRIKPYFNSFPSAPVSAPSKYKLEIQINRNFLKERPSNEIPPYSPGEKICGEVMEFDFAEDDFFVLDMYCKDTVDQEAVTINLLVPLTIRTKGISPDLLFPSDPRLHVATVMVFLGVKEDTTNTKPGPIRFEAAHQYFPLNQVGNGWMETGQREICDEKVCTPLVKANYTVSYLVTPL